MSASDTVLTYVSREPPGDALTAPAVVVAIHDDGTYDVALPCMDATYDLCHWQPLRLVEVGSHPVVCDRCGSVYRVQLAAA